MRFLRFGCSDADQGTPAATLSKVDNVGIRRNTIRDTTTLTEYILVLPAHGPEMCTVRSMLVSTFGITYGMLSTMVEHSIFFLHAAFLHSRDLLPTGIDAKQVRV